MPETNGGLGNSPSRPCKWHDIARRSEGSHPFPYKLRFKRYGNPNSPRDCILPRLYTLRVCSRWFPSPFWTVNDRFLKRIRDSSGSFADYLGLNFLFVTHALVLRLAHARKETSNSQRISERKRERAIFESFRPPPVSNSKPFPFCLD